MTAEDTTAADVERIAIDNGKAQLAAGTPVAEIAAGLAQAAALIEAVDEQATP